MHGISNASSIFLFNILYVFAFVKMMYFECQNKQVSRKIIIKKNKSQFCFPAASISWGQQVCKTSIQRKWPIKEKKKLLIVLSLSILMAVFHVWEHSYETYHVWKVKLLKRILILLKATRRGAQVWNIVFVLVCCL